MSIDYFMESQKHIESLKAEVAQLKAENESLKKDIPGMMLESRRIGAESISMLFVEGHLLEWAQRHYVTKREQAKIAVKEWEAQQNAK